MDTLNHTHDPAALSWVPGAQGHQDFPLQNLPVAVFRRQGEEEAFRGGMAIGDQIVDLAALSSARLAWVHRERRRHDLVAPLVYPWRERAEAAGG